jgi:pimeloyl-ACP methyl ester carboxylesterase
VIPAAELDAAIYASGPWMHRDISANGARFHIAELGSGPVVLFLHGFPTYWWTWRSHLEAFAAAGYRAIAMDLRGYGGSDHPPEGYDLPTLTADVDAVLRSIGAEDAVVIGHGWGGLIAWSLAAMYPDSVGAIVPIAAPHPRSLRKWNTARNMSVLRKTLSWQLPFWPEHALQADDGEKIDQLLRTWSATPEWPDPQASRMYRAAFCRWPTAHTAIEYQRWAVRSLPRSDGRQYMERMTTPIDVPVLHLHGDADPVVPSHCCDDSGTYVTGAYQLTYLPGGHFVHEEAHSQVIDTIVQWLAQVR